jgi:predicted transcriptional regulator
MKIIEQLIPFGLTQQEAEVYVALYKQDAKTPLWVAQATGLNRTTSYRILEALETKGFVKQALDYKSVRFIANPAENFTHVFSQKEAELQKLKENIVPLEKLLDQLPDNTNAGPTKVLYFKGVSGLRQLLWNTLAATNDVVGFGYADWNAGIGKKFAEKIRAEYIERNIHAKELLNEDQIDSSYRYTDLSAYRRVYEHRMIPKKILTIRHDTYIYNDVVAYYHIFQDEMFGLEIHNAEIAQTERQIFFILWALAKKVK